MKKLIVLLLLLASSCSSSSNPKYSMYYIIGCADGALKVKDLLNLQLTHEQAQKITDYCTREGGGAQ